MVAEEAEKENQGDYEQKFIYPLILPLSPVEFVEKMDTLAKLNAFLLTMNGVTLEQVKEDLRREYGEKIKEIEEKLNNSKAG